MTIIYRKTAKGVAEIDTRAHRLSPRLRSALIMVDGKRSDAELATMLPQAAESLAALAGDGFIEAMAELAAPPPPAPRPLPPAPAPVAAAADPNFEPRRRAVLRAFNDLVGPAGEAMALKLEKAKSADDLRLLLPQAVRLVDMVQGRAAADRFSARLDEL